ncbi:hypothetical protein DRQ07_00410, partial [candidate division KSB1 bacterium]
VINDIREEMRDRFGTVPDEAETLLQVAGIRLMAQKNGFKRVTISEKDARLYLDESWPEHFETQELFTDYIRSFIDSSDNEIRFLSGDSFGIRVFFNGKEPFTVLKKLLQR